MFKEIVLPFFLKHKASCVGYIFLCDYDNASFEFEHFVKKYN